MWDGFLDGLLLAMHVQACRGLCVCVWSGSSARACQCATSAAHPCCHSGWSSCDPHLIRHGLSNPRLLQEFQASFMAAKQAHASWLQTPGEPFSQVEARQAAFDARYAEVRCCSS